MKTLFATVKNIVIRGCIVFLVSSFANIELFAQNIPQTLRNTVRLAKSEKEMLPLSEKKLSSNLYKVLKKMKLAVVSRENMFGKNVKKAFSTPLVNVDDRGRIFVTLRTTQITSSLLTQLAALEFELVSSTENLDVTSNHQMITGWAHFDRIDDIAKLASVFHIRPADKPFILTGAVNTAGDAILRADTTRRAFCVDGSGQKVGVVSSDVDSLTHSQGSGDLPPMIDIINNRYGTGHNEGTAMLEIVHDLAPEAELAFADAGSGQVDFANNINLLRDAGCTVITDDIIYFREPAYEDGVIAQTIDNVVNNNDVVYISAAGNEQGSHYEGDFFDNDDNDGFHNFGLGDETINVQLNPGDTLIVVLQWNNQFGRAADDYDLIIFDAALSDTLALSNNIQNGTGDPLEIVDYPNSTGSAITVHIAVFRNSGADRRLSIFSFGDGTLESQHVNSDGTIFGHPAAQRCLAVGAINANDSGNNDIAGYSSHGPSRIYSYDSNGNPTGFVDRPKPDHVAIDGVETKVGQLGFFRGNPFFGTSAAAPHTAGIAALVREAKPSLTAIQVGNVLNDTAVDLGEVGFDSVFGNGRVDAFNGLSSIRSAGCADIALVIDRSGSMSGQKIADAKTAASTFVDFIQPGDNIAVISFSSSASVNFPLTTIVGDETKTAAQDAINSISASGATSIGGGMQLGQGELDKGDPNHPHAMLLLSDGIENRAPFVADILPGIPETTDIYTIGLGSDADQRLLSNIANATGGTYNFAPTSDSLQQIYLRIRGQITGQQTIASFTGTITQGETITHSLPLDDLASFATFSLIFQGSDVDLELITPSGTLIDPQAADSDPNITYSEGNTFDFYTISSPEAGEWDMKVIGVDVPSPETYFATIQVNSNLNMDVFLDKNDYDAGEPILVSADLTENSQPILGATVNTEVTLPSSSTFAYQKTRSSFNNEDEEEITSHKNKDKLNDKISQIESFDGRSLSFITSIFTLFDDGLHADGAANDGVYANYFTNTVNDGSYTFTVKASGTAQQGGPFMRESTLSTFVNPSTAPAVVSVSPDSAHQSETLNITINGANFVNGATVAFSGTGVTVNSVTVNSDIEIIVDITIAADAEPGLRDITVTNPDGQQGFGPGIFSVISCGTISFFDDFEDGNADDWVPNDPAKWAVQSTDGNLAYCMKKANGEGDEYSILSIIWKDFVLEIDAKALQQRSIFIIFGVPTFTNSTATSYYLKFGKTDVELFRSLAAGQGVLIASAPNDFVSDGGFHHIKIERQFPSIQVEVDSQFLFTVNDDTFSEGYIGVGSHRSRACFDNVNVTGVTDCLAAAEIKPEVTTPPVIGEEFWVDVAVDSVQNLFGASFELHYTNTNYIDVVSPDSVVEGSFLGEDVLFFPNVEDDSSKVSIGISRKAGQSGVSGSGVVARIKFKSLPSTPSGTEVVFSLTDIVANDPSGSPINMIPSGATTTLIGILVWPGDTNNDGKVDQADVLPIGLCWAQTGPPRDNPACNWEGQSASPWSNKACTYGDANGNGVVNQADVLCIGLNWGKMHGTLALNKAGANSQVTLNKLASENLEILITGEANPGQDFFIDIYANGVTNLFGLSYELFYSPNSFIEPLSAEPGEDNLLGDDIIFFPNVDTTAGKVSIGITRKAGQGGADGSGLVTRILTRMSSNATIGEDTTWLSIKNIQANDSEGNPVHFDTTNVTLVPIATDIELAVSNIPNEYALHQNYPNPFNPETRIQYDLPKSSHVKLEIFNLLGQRIRTLVDEEKAAGSYMMVWDGRRENGEPAASGVYVYRLKTGEFEKSRKLLLLR